MRHIHHIAYLFVALVASFLITACGEDYSGDIDKLNSQYSDIDRRVTTLESQVRTLNSQLGQLSVLAQAAEQNFYITSVKTTGDTYELTLSNGRVIILQKGTDNTLIPMPAVSMTQISGFYYWTLNGVLLMGDDGKPVRSDGVTPILRYDYTTQQWVISIDGGTTFKEVSAYVSVVINDKVLLQVINNYIREHSTTFISQDILFQVISTYIQQNYASLFDIRILNEVVATYISEHYTRIFSYELLEKIFTQYNFSYITDQIDVDKLVNVMLTFIREHQEVFMNNEVLYEIISSYFQVNKTTIFTNELLLEVINNFFQNNSSYLNVELLTQVVHNYIEQHKEEVFNIESVRNLLFQYVQHNYVQVFSQYILTQVINNYVTHNKTTIFNETLIKEVINTYVENNYTTIFTKEIMYDIISNYLNVNGTTVIDRDVLVEVIVNYFEKNYYLFIDETVVRQAVNNYIDRHSTTIISVEIIEQVIYTYLEQYCYEVFSYDMITTVIHDYFEHNTQVISQYVSGLISGVTVNDDVCYVTLNNGNTLQLVVYDAYARLRDRVQSIVVMPEANGHVKESPNGTIALRYLVSPAAMASVIASKYYNGEIALDLKVTDANSNVTTISCDGIEGHDGVLTLLGIDYPVGAAKTVALHVMETKTGGTDIMTEFTPVDSEGGTPDNSFCPDNNHPHMIDLGLPSGTKWACCNVDASKPQDYGGYYAWGETKTKNSYSVETYQYYSPTKGYQDIGYDICGTNYDVAYVKWGEAWQMPSREQYLELVENCTYIWSPTVNNYFGCIFTGKNGARIFLPASGYYNGYELNSIGYNGDYWSGTLSSYGNSDAYWLNFSDQYVDWGSHATRRFLGHTIRPVSRTATNKQLSLSTYSLSLKVGEEKTVSITSGSGSYTIQSNNYGLAKVSLNGNTITVVGAQQGSFYINVIDTKSGQTAIIAVTVSTASNGYLSCPDSKHPHMIDLGLPSGTLWACCNVDASKPEGYGGYYAWGETKEKKDYSEETYLYYKNGKYQNIGTNISGTNYDVAHVKWGGAWCMPTDKDYLELYNNCSFTWTTLNKIKGQKFTSKKNGGSIFLPASGGRSGTRLDELGSWGEYWLSSYYPDPDKDNCAYGFIFWDDGTNAYMVASRKSGFPVRPVVYVYDDFFYSRKKAKVYYGDKENIIPPRIIKVND